MCNSLPSPGRCVVSVCLLGKAVVSHVAPLSPTVGLFRQLAVEMDSEEKAQQDLLEQPSWHNNCSSLCESALKISKQGIWILKNFKALAANRLHFYTFQIQGLRVWRTRQCEHVAKWPENHTAWIELAVKQDIFNVFNLMSANRSCKLGDVEHLHPLANWMSRQVEDCKW
eukprot:5171046-Amphidinium_carterae.1